MKIGSTRKGEAMFLGQQEYNKIKKNTFVRICLAKKQMGTTQAGQEYCNKKQTVHQYRVI